MRTTTTVTFGCEPETLWTWLEEPERQKQWMVGVVDNELVEGDGGVGSRLRMRIKEGGKVSEYAGEITAHDQPRRLTVRFWGGSFSPGMVMEADYRLSAAQEGGTQLDYSAGLVEGRMPLPFRLLAPLVKLMNVMMMRKFMKNLRRCVDGG